MSLAIDQAQRPGLGRRLAAIGYDGLLLAALLILADALVVIPLGLLDIGADKLGQHPLFRGYLLLVILAFFSGFWMRGGQTLGMRAWRLRLVRMDGNPVRLADSLKRLGAACLSWLALGLGFAWILVDREGLAWHDRLSGTRLLLVPRPPKA